MDSLVSLTFSIFYLSELKSSISQVADLTICLNRLEKAHHQFCNSIDKNREDQDSTIVLDIGTSPDTISLSIDAKPIKCKSWELDSRKMKTGCFFRLKRIGNHQ
jgi:hypothetical protein